MRKLLLTICVFFGLCLTMGAQQMEGQKEMVEMSLSEVSSLYQIQSRKWKSVHDPSVVWDAATQTLYIYGSHYYGVKTKDFKTYSDITRYYKGGYESKDAYKAFKSNPIHTVKRCLPGKTEVEEVTLPSFDASTFCSTYALSESSWVSGDQWAPDIVYNPNMKKWCYYLSLNGDYWASVVLLMTADKPEGPFTYEAPVVFGGFDGQTRSGKHVDYKKTDLEVVLGTQSSLPSRYKTSAWGNLWPNCIDPCAFFDEEGELWLAYGSWSGGVFMLKLDKNTGLRDYTTTYASTTYAGRAPNGASFTGYTSDPYFGKLIAGGCYVSGEGPYIQHIGDYYYLFMSYGGFAPDGGYEMRVFRSEKPDGPYKDASGNLATYTAYQLNYGTNAATDKGMKLIGAMNNWGLMTVGECAQGHNSACQDDKGRTFLVCHTKFNDGTIGHQIRVYQLYLNKQGWLCAAPFQFDGEEITDELLATTQPWSAADIEGDYHVLIHPYRLDHAKMQEATPSIIHLSAEGKVTGGYRGSWSYTDEGKSYIQIRLGAVTYYGVVVEQTLEGSNAKALCFTAVSNTGVPCWGYKMQPQYAIAYNYSQYSSTYFKRTMFSRVTSDKEILFTPEENVTLSWTSSNPDILSNTGKFTAPTEDTSFTMTARMECGNFYWQRDFSAKAIADPSSISEVSMSEQVNKCSNDVFDLMGRRVEKPSRGFYLVNGKKVWFQ
ncbi:MAG: glycoside hydrolase family 43 protein [Prevotella sp.]|nr:glycoside hydrolase family 43 protein [Prevotella sp.]